MSGIDISDLIPEFLSEAREHLATLEKGLLALEISSVEARKASVNSMFRAAHTIKGSARVMGFQSVHTVAHAMEDVLGEVREGSRGVDSPLIDGLLFGVDFLRLLIEKPPDTTEGVADAVKRIRILLGAQTAPAPSPAEAAVTPSPAAAAALVPSPEGEGGAPAAPSVAGPAGGTAAGPAVEAAPPLEDTVRLAVARLDELARLSGELTMGVQAAEDLDRQASSVLSAGLHLMRQVARSSAALAAAELDPASMRSSIEALSELKTRLSEVTRGLVTTADRVEQEVMSLRLHPVGTVFASLPRLVRDLSKEHAKDIGLTISGEGTELDRRILQGLSEPLLHVVRNSVDHGLEPPAERREKGKPPTGRLSVRALRKGGNVLVEVEDDGRGLWPEKLREAAVKKRLITAEQAAAMDDLTALELIYLPGFSTSTFVSSTSGRGVGMDAVKSALTRLGGSIDLWTEAGKGTRLTFVLPLTLTIARVVLAEVAGRVHALPTGSVERIVRLTPERVTSVGAREQLLMGSQVIALHRLDRVLGSSADPADELAPHAGEPALVFSSSGQRYAFAVDRILDEREAVLKPLGDLLGQGELTASATLLSDGTVVLVLDPAACARAARGGGRRLTAAARAERKTRVILVVDDSPTTRELERSILAAAGHEVETAVDGAEGWKKVQEGRFELVVTDVEMPNMTGFELTRAIKADPRLAHLPIVIITTLDRESERRKGLEAGAQAYLVKNAFDQTELLETIERLLP